jgi:hypothetical protein
MEAVVEVVEEKVKCALTQRWQSEETNPPACNGAHFGRFSE